MQTSVMYQISQVIFIVVLSFVGAFMCVRSDWAGSESIYTMLLLGVSLSIAGLTSAYFAGGTTELYDIMLLKKFSMSGRLLLIGYSSTLASVWLFSYIRIVGRDSD